MMVSSGHQYFASLWPDAHDLNRHADERLDSIEGNGERHRGDPPDRLVWVTGSGQPGIVSYTGSISARSSASGGKRSVTVPSGRR